MKLGQISTTETLKEAVMDYLLTRHPELSVIPDELRDFILEYERKNRKSNAFLLYVIGKETIFRVAAKYENVTKEEIPFKIMKDATLGMFANVNLFFKLLNYRGDLLKGHKIYDQAFNNREGLRGRRTAMGSWCDVGPQLIEYLYTKILTPQDLIDDIEKPLPGQFINYCVCFEDDNTRRLLKIGGILKE